MVKDLSAEMLEHAYKGGFVACKHIHDHRCEWTAFIKFITTFNKAIKFYLPLHFIPVLLFKWKKLKEEPKKTLTNAAKNIAMSSFCLDTYLMIFRYLLCKLKNVRGKMDRWNLIGACFFCGFAIIFESEPRRNELALYLIPRALEAIFNYNVKIGRVSGFKNGEVLVFASCMSSIMYCY